MNPNIWAIIPAHNEEKVIKETILDLINQTLQISVLVVADNCTDGTIEIVKELQKKHSNISLMETVDNNKRKAGAINQGLSTLDHSLDAVLLMDADTRIHPKAIEKGWSKLSKKPKLAAVCSKAGVLPSKTKNLLSWFLYRLQRLEYSTFDSQRVETLNRIKVVHGMAALHRWKALQQVGFYDEGNLVEDYELTLRYKERGWNVTVALDMKAWTDIPISWKEWWIQRLRWNRGGLDTLKQHGWNKATKGDILQHVWINILILFQWFFLIAFVFMIINGNVLMHVVIVVAILIGMANSIYRLSYLENANVCDFLVRILIIPEMIYGYIITFNWYHAYFLFLFKKQQSW
jgi:poly-beta-1,6-N-acetyl-D-glucosamine synthase